MAGAPGAGPCRQRAPAGVHRGATLTPAEITILRSLAEADVVIFMPEGHTAAALGRFETTLESLREIQKAGWVELEVADDRKRVRGRHRQKVKGAAARCTAAGRGALRRVLAIHCFCQRARDLFQSRKIVPAEQIRVT